MADDKSKKTVELSMSDVIHENPELEDGMGKRGTVKECSYVWITLITLVFPTHGLVPKIVFLGLQACWTCQIISGERF